VIVDGDHGYDGCSADLDASCKATDRIIVHDYGRTERHLRDVTEAANRFCERDWFRVTEHRGETVALLERIGE